jgi:hypothetical protein
VSRSVHEICPFGNISRSLPSRCAGAGLSAASATCLASVPVVSLGCQNILLGRGPAGIRRPRVVASHLPFPYLLSILFVPMTPCLELHMHSIAFEHIVCYTCCAALAYPCEHKALSSLLDKADTIHTKHGIGSYLVMSLRPERHESIFWFFDPVLGCGPQRSLGSFPCQQLGISVRLWSSGKRMTTLGIDMCVTPDDHASHRLIQPGRAYARGCTTY